MSIYINKNNRQSGPFAEANIREMLAGGQLSPDDLAIRRGDQHWQKLGAMFPNAASSPASAAQPSTTAPTAAKKSRKKIFLGCGGVLLVLFLIAGVLGIFAYRNLYPSGTAANLPEKIGSFTIENPAELKTPRGNVWGTEKKYVTKYKSSTDSYAIIILDEYASESAAENFYANLPASEWCGGDRPLYIDYKKAGRETSKVTVCKAYFVKHDNQIFNVIVLSQDRVGDTKDILDNLPFNSGANGAVKE